MNIGDTIPASHWGGPEHETWTLVYRYGQGEEIVYLFVVPSATDAAPHYRCTVGLDGDVYGCASYETNPMDAIAAELARVADWCDRLVSRV